MSLLLNASSSSLFDATVFVNRNYFVTAVPVFVLLAIAWPLNTAIVVAGIRKSVKDTPRFRFCITLMTLCNMYSLATNSILNIYYMTYYWLSIETSLMLCTALKRIATCSVAPFYACVMAIGLDRLLVICYNRTMSLFTLVVLTMLGLVTQLLMNAFQLFIGNHLESDVVCTMAKTAPPTVAFLLLAISFAGFIFIFICNTRVLLYIRNQRRRFSLKAQRHSMDDLNRERKVAINLIVQTLTPIATQSPYPIMLLLHYAGPISLAIISSAAVLNFALNPLISAVFFDSFRDAFGVCLMRRIMPSYKRSSKSSVISISGRGGRDKSTVPKI